MIPPGWTCQRRIGFLFPHPCDRLTPVGCPHCHNGQIDDPYASRTDRGVYADYDTYQYASFPAFSHDRTDFTEADGETLVRPDDAFEDDMTAS